VAKRKRLPKLTPEELARREETTRMLEERIAYHEAKAVENGEVLPEVAKRHLALRAAVAKSTGRKLTAEELALRAETQRMVEERIAYHGAKAREEEEARREQDAS
jgi:hypothetical protein